MAFWDNLGHRASETTAKAMQKAKEISDISKINSNISEEEKKINNIYLQIGKKYMALHKHDCEEELSELVHEIIDSEQKIESWKKQIQDIKGVQRCEKCGAEIAQGSAFCSSCGAPVPKIQTSETVEMSTCKNCGASIKKGVRFCTSCGTKIDLEEGENTKAALSQENKDEEIETRVCPKCGAEIQNNNDFCTECGTKLQ